MWACYGKTTRSCCVFPVITTRHCSLSNGCIFPLTRSIFIRSRASVIPAIRWIVRKQRSMALACLSIFILSMARAIRRRMASAFTVRPRLIGARSFFLAWNILCQVIRHPGAPRSNGSLIKLRSCIQPIIMQKNWTILQR